MSQKVERQFWKSRVSRVGLDTFWHFISICYSNLGSGTVRNNVEQIKCASPPCRLSHFCNDPRIVLCRLYSISYLICQLSFHRIKNLFYSVNLSWLYVLMTNLIWKLSNYNVSLSLLFLNHCGIILKYGGGSVNRCVVVVICFSFLFLLSFFFKQ